jgi:hypothetical protein
VWGQTELYFDLLTIVPKEDDSYLGARAWPLRPTRVLLEASLGEFFELVPTVNPSASYAPTLGG